MKISFRPGKPGSFSTCLFSERAGRRKRRSTTAEAAFGNLDLGGKARSLPPLEQGRDAVGHALPPGGEERADEERIVADDDDPAARAGRSRGGVLRNDL